LLDQCSTTPTTKFAPADKQNQRQSRTKGKAKRPGNLQSFQQQEIDFFIFDNYFSVSQQN
jgi:hypothetical protein